MIKKLFQRWNRHRVIMDRVNGEPYLERYYVFLKDRDRFPFNIFVHKFLKSDPDDVHDHPWPYFTIILKGWLLGVVASVQWARCQRYMNIRCGAVQAVRDLLALKRITELNWIQQWNVGPCSCPVSNNVTGDSWSKISGCSGRNT
jgi:hypothetical protein